MALFQKREYFKGIILRRIYHISLVTYCMSMTLKILLFIITPFEGKRPLNIGYIRITCYYKS